MIPLHATADLLGAPLALVFMFLFQAFHALRLAPVDDAKIDASRSHRGPP